MNARTLLTPEEMSALMASSTALAPRRPGRLRLAAARFFYALAERLQGAA